MRNFLSNISYCNKDQNRQRPASKTMYICGFYPSKLGLHPEMLPSLAYIIKLLKIIKTGLLMYVYFLLYVYLFYILTNSYFHTHLTSSLNLADLLFLFIIPFRTIFTITFYLNMLFLNFGMQSFKKGFQLSSKFRPFSKVDILEKLYYICIFS